MPVLRSLLPSLVYALPERQRLQKRVVLEDGVARCVPVSELTHLLLTVTCHLHETMQCYCSLGHSIGYAANCSPFSSVWQTHQEKLESEWAPRFQDFCSPIIIKMCLRSLEINQRRILSLSLGEPWYYQGGLHCLLVEAHKEWLSKILASVFPIGFIV